MKKRVIIVIGIITIAMIIILGMKVYKQYKINHAIKIVELNTNEVEVFSKIRLKDLIKTINGKLISNPLIDTTKVKEQEITFNYITDKNLTVPYTIRIKVIDKTPPIIYQPSSYTVIVNETTKKELEKSFFCGDNYDSNPECTLEGDLDFNTPGEYQASFIGKDSSNNISTHPFILKVKEKNNNSTNTSSNQSYTDFNSILHDYKNKNNKVGIDISHWQGKIDFNKVKETGVEFVYIRVGRGNGIGKEYVLDDRFKEYIKGFNKAKIPVGIYFYSNANSKEDAKKEAKWVLSKIKKYQVDLEIVFDWENWNYFQEYDLSFYSLTEIAKTFIKTVEKEGYQGMLYSSKNYLENIWFPLKSNIWLAHYTKKSDYEGPYKVWQICNDGKVDGINDNLVDIDIRYY